MHNYKTIIVGIDSKYNEIISTTLKITNNLYNQAAYTLRQNLFNHNNNSKANKNIHFEEKFPDMRDKDFYEYIKSLDNYKSIPSQTAQMVINKAVGNFKSYQALLKLQGELPLCGKREHSGVKEKGDYEHQINLPRYNNKDNEFEADFNKDNIRINYSKDSNTIITLTTKKEYTYLDSKLKEHKIINKEGKIVITISGIVKNIKSVKLIKNSSIFSSIPLYTAHIIYSDTNETTPNLGERMKEKRQYENEEKSRKIDINNENAIYCDLGVVYLISVLYPDGEVELYTAAAAKNINYIVNKTKAKLQSNLDLLFPKEPFIKRNLLLNILKDMYYIEYNDMKTNPYSTLEKLNSIQIENITKLLEEKLKEFYVTNGEKVIIFDRKKYTVKEILNNKELLERIEKNHTRKINKLYNRRKNIIKSEFHAIANTIVKKLEEMTYPVEHGKGQTQEITEIVCGKNEEWKNEADLKSKKNNQKFQQLPHNKLLHYLQYKTVTKENPHGMVTVIKYL